MTTSTERVLRKCVAPVNKLSLRCMNRSEVELKTMRECPTLHPESFIDIAKRLKIRKPDITGYIRGRMTIVGFLGFADKSDKLNDSRWAARCTCGMYETRTYRNFIRGFLNGKDDCCENCYDPEGPKFEKTKIGG